MLMMTLVPANANEIIVYIIGFLSVDIITYPNNDKIHLWIISLCTYIENKDKYLRQIYSSI